MAHTTMTTSDNLRKQVWEEKLFRDTVKESYFFKKFAPSYVRDLEKGSLNDSSPNDVIYVKTNLEAQGRSKVRPGDKITFGIVPRIDPVTYRGVRSGQTLKGKEVALSWYSYSLELERYRQAVSAGSPMDWQKASFNMPREAETALLNWGVELCELLCVEALTDSATQIFYKTSDTGPTVARTATAATAKSALDASASKITPQFISFLRTWAETGGDRTIIPPRPIMVDGEAYFIYLCHPDVLYDWKNDSTVLQAHREAMERGSSNPIFAGAKYIWDRVIIHTSEFMPKAADGGDGSVPWAKSVFMGAQALCWAWGERPSIVEDSEDYQEDLFYAWRMTAKAGKPQFNSQDYGSINVYVSRTNVSGLSAS